MGISGFQLEMNIVEVRGVLVSEVHRVDAAAARTAIPSNLHRLVHPHAPTDLQDLRQASACVLSPALLGGGEHVATGAARPALPLLVARDLHLVPDRTDPLEGSHRTNVELPT